MGETEEPIIADRTGWYLMDCIGETYTYIGDIDDAIQFLENEGELTEMVVDMVTINNYFEDFIRCAFEDECLYLDRNDMLAEFKEEMQNDGRVELGGDVLEYYQEGEILSW